MTEPARRSVSELRVEERERLEAADRELREAVAAYEEYVGGELDPSGPVRTRDRAGLSEAQAAVERAEEQLWAVREELLGWARPHWAPGAALTADWFSEEDTVYDDLPEATLPQ